MIIITDENLNGAGEKIAHGFFGRQGGVSKGIYDSLNCGPGSADEAAAVSENRARVADHFGAPPDHLATDWQIIRPSHTSTAQNQKETARILVDREPEPSCS